ncbi:hypothetical protein [Dactylosporangium darangshiense]|uniref:C2H2-type domain-containing protein n=1 Tax=Dactylosporangium darangshiense TaxID=579108 RepID=A0ABP8DS44_9ACTN
MPANRVTTADQAPNAADSPLPPIPMWLAHRPVVAGLAVPWITARGLDGRYLFGGLDPQRQHQAITEHRCQVCGRELDWRSILLLRRSDLPRHRTPEPALDPVCAAYTAAACPMVAGRMTRHRSTPITLGHGISSAVDQPARLGAPAEPWFAVWLDRYTTATDDNRLLIASYDGIRPRRIRPITWRLPPTW